MEGFTANKYKQLVSDMEPRRSYKINMNNVNDALLRGDKKFWIVQDVCGSKEGLQNKINEYLGQYNDDNYSVTAIVESLELEDNAMDISYFSVVNLDVVEKVKVVLKTEEFTASKYKQLVLDNEVKINMEDVEKALFNGIKRFSFSQNSCHSKEELQKKINEYLSKYDDSNNCIIANVESLMYEREDGMVITYSSKIKLDVITKSMKDLFYKC